MKILKKEDLYISGDYIGLKKLSIKTGIRRGIIKDDSLKGNYLINPREEKLFDSKNYEVLKENDVENLMYYTEELNGLFLVETIYSNKSREMGAKFKVYYILNGVKYILSFNDFEEVYKECMVVLEKEIKLDKELEYVKAGFSNLEKTEVKVDLKTNLKRVKEFREKVDYKRNVPYFVINNTLATTTKFDIKTKAAKVKTDKNTTVLRYDSRDRLYYVMPDGDITLRETDLIVSLGDINKVHIYTNYGLGKLLDIENNVIPTKNNISLFANILDLGLKVLG
ncbi:MAG: hypothetical protein ACRC28_16245 [Clostridium sp.]|uniref:hypothetical protein n=1 Tax=Clostridium sp. TaxID=1506 RepID=UPI003F2B06A1